MVVAIIAILMAIAIPNILGALHRARQKRTMADMRAIALAWEARKVEAVGYNAAGYELLPNPVSNEQLQGGLVPTYIRILPSKDGWGNPLGFGTDEEWGGDTEATSYQIISGGRDGVFNASVPIGPTTHYDCDIVFHGGTFIVFPEGVQAGS